MKKKKVDRPAVGAGAKRAMFTSRVDPKILKHAKRECKRIFKVGLSSKFEDILIKEFGRP